MIKNSLVATTIAISLVLSISSEAKARNINSYEDYKLHCSPGAYQYNVQSPYCNQYKKIYENRLQQELNQWYIRRSNTEQENSRNRYDNIIKPYLGGTLGVFFPDLDEANTGFGGSIFAGAKFNKNFGADLEFGLLGGGTDFEDVDYSVWALFVNPRLILPFTDKKNSSHLFFSPGIGISKAEVDLGNSMSVEDDTRFTWQIKLGLSFPIADRYNSFAQVRYATQTEDNTIDFFSSEVGFSIEF